MIPTRKKTSPWRNTALVAVLLAIAIVLAFRAIVLSIGEPEVAPGSGGVNRPEVRERPYVILLSLDGFRADYLDLFSAPNLQRLARGGVRAESLIPVFPSSTFPNHYSIATGLYADRHGIVANSFSDPERNERFTLADRSTVEDGTWYRGEPIWVTAERQGMVAGSYFWVGSEAAIQGIRPTFWNRYDGRVPNEARVDAVLEWLALPAEHRPHLITLYMSDVDSAGHRHGPASPEVAGAIEQVDGALGRLLDGIEALPFRERVVVVVVSDHGMAGIDPGKTAVLADLIDLTGVHVADTGAKASLHVEGDAARAARLKEALNRGLENGRAYLREEVPERLRYSADPRVGDVVVIMDEPHQVRLGVGASPNRGAHGWDPASPTMHGIFIAAGPTLPAGATLPSFEAIHIYPFLTELLGLEPASGIDGEAGRVRRLIAGQ